MQRKLLFSYITIILFAICTTAIALWGRSYKFIYEQSNNYYLTQAKLLSKIFDEEEFLDKSEYINFVEFYSKEYNIRITIIDNEGNVYADSEIDESLENHANREEVIRALHGESNTVIRYSKTMNREYSYSAVPIKNKDFYGVMRISLPVDEFNKLKISFTDSIIYSILICIVIALILAFIFTKLLFKPINDVTKAAEKISDGKYNIKIYTRDKTEMGRLAEAFNLMAENLKGTIHSLTQRNVELEAMLSSMAAGVVAINDTNEILFYNNSFLKLIKLKNRKLEGQSLYNILRNTAVFDAIEEIRDKHKSITKEGTLINGDLRNVRITATLLGRENEETFGVLLIIEDITQMKKLESIRSDFVSNVTHELKTPLTSIRGFVDTLKNGAIHNEGVANKFLDIIDIEAERLSNLIQDILLLSEIEAKRDYGLIPCDINQCILDVISILEPKLTEQVSIVFEPEVDLKPFVCNPDRIKQLFINLLDNAIKYTEKGTITILISELQHKLSIKIKDTGIGIEKDHLPRIFERFYRVDKGRSRKQGGTGLGLSIVKHIVELYNGKVWINSEVGVGTEFTILLPYIEDNLS